MRYYYFDFARSILMIYGIIYHSALVFSSYNWRVNSIESSLIFNYIVDFSLLFRMQAFYTIAGFFSAMLILKYGNKQFIKNRLIRLGVPLVFCGLTFNSLMNIVTFRQGHWSDFFPWILSWPYWVVGVWLGHLWFLMNLIVYVVVVSVISTRLNKIIDGFKISYIIILIAIPIISYLSIRVGWKIPHFFGVENYVLIRLIKYYPYFLFGYLLYFNKSLIDELSKYMYINLFLLVSITFVIESYVKSFGSNFIYETMTHLSSLLIVLIMINLSKKYFSKNSFFLQSISDASYTIYLIHMPLIVFITPLILYFKINIFLQFIFLVSIVYLISYYFHCFIVAKSKYMSFLFNGK